MSPDATLSTIKQFAGHDGKCCDFYKLEIPNLHHGTLDSLIALSDELTRVNTMVESVVRKVERQYFEMRAHDPNKKTPIPILKVQERTIDSYLQRWSWDFARYQHQGKKLGELVNQMTVLASTTDEELKALLATHSEKLQSLTMWQRKKVINLVSSDFEDFLTLEQLRNFDIQDNEHLVTLFVVCNKAMQEDFLANYCSADGNDDGWARSIACFGAPGDREATKGSPVVPGSAVLVYETESQVMYSIAVLRGHSTSGRIDPATATFIPGTHVDYIAPITAAFREKRCTVRRLKKPATSSTDAPSSSSNSTHSSESIQATAQEGLLANLVRAQAELDHSQNTIIRWSASHYGDAMAAFVHLKVISAYLESVLRYGVPADFCAFFAVPLPGMRVQAKAALLDAVLKTCPRLLEDQSRDDFDVDDDEGGGGQSEGKQWPFVCHYIRLPISTAAVGA